VLPLDLQNIFCCELCITLNLSSLHIESISADGTVRNYVSRAAERKCSVLGLSVKGENYGNVTAYHPSDDRSLPAFRFLRLTVEDVLLKANRERHFQIKKIALPDMMSENSHLCLKRWHRPLIVDISIDFRFRTRYLEPKSDR
jgi:hypothetical protein